MTTAFDQSLIWHVIFHPEPKWWARKHSHVSLAGFANDTWLHLDLGREGVGVSAIYAHDEVHDFLSLLLAHYTVLRFGPAVRQRPHFWRPMTCVSFAKHVLGVRSSALLPDGLLRDLRRDYGAEVLHEAENAKGNKGASATEASR